MLEFYLLVPGEYSGYVGVSDHDKIDRISSELEIIQNDLGIVMGADIASIFPHSLSPTGFLQWIVMYHQNVIFQDCFRKRR